MTLLLGLSTPAVNASNYDSGVFEFQQKLAKGGNAQAQYQLATMYESGRGVAKNIGKAREWYEKAAANNFTAAKHRLTYLDIKTKGFKASHKGWVSELSNDAKKGNGEAMYILGDMYQNGIGVKQNLKRAQEYYKSSATRGNVDAENRLFEVEQQLQRQQAQQQQQNRAREEAARKQAEQERMAQQRAAKAEEARQARMKADAEKQRLENERRRLDAERRKLEAQQRALQAQKAAQQKAAEAEAKKAEDDKFEAELCTGKAARFRTQCN